jgi:hypothetical protein
MDFEKYFPKEEMIAHLMVFMDGKKITCDPSQISISKELVLCLQTENEMVEMRIDREILSRIRHAIKMSKPRRVYSNETFSFSIEESNLVIARKQFEEPDPNEKEPTSFTHGPIHHHPYYQRRLKLFYRIDVFKIPMTRQKITQLIQSFDTIHAANKEGEKIVFARDFHVFRYREGMF